MSAWFYSSKVDITKLLDLAEQLDKVPEMLLTVAEETADRVRENIIDKDIIDKGDLLDSISARLVNDNMSVVQDGVEHGVYNEFGTSKMAARTFFIPALEESGEIIEREFFELFK